MTSASKVIQEDTKVTNVQNKECESSVKSSHNQEIHSKAKEQKTIDSSDGYVSCPPPSTPPPPPPQLIGDNIANLSQRVNQAFESVTRHANTSNPPPIPSRAKPPVPPPANAPPPLPARTTVIQSSAAPQKPEE